MPIQINFDLEPLILLSPKPAGAVHRVITLSFVAIKCVNRLNMYLNKPNKFLNRQKNPPIGCKNEINGLDNVVNRLKEAPNRVNIGFKSVDIAFPRGRRVDNWVNNAQF